MIVTAGPGIRCPPGNRRRALLRFWVMATKVDPKNKAKAPKAGFLTVVVDADEYEEALLDPLVHKTNVEAAEFLEKLEREGRSL